ncbi:hypothetical protein CAOG_008322 [Capsaspora owczarzaki ATCC 30864]|uniref:Uncharacterized protein n=1 Tax=Capsaspora owczarzaki (strain ATCC 30864) TaxID=595528 RepID=A0A0D2X5T2_CAPO3|nr:hypothetical protein CAOG_008322 [Capsaspora owczarzaki ATCC 30864]
MLSGRLVTTVAFLVLAALVHNSSGAYQIRNLHFLSPTQNTAVSCTSSSTQLDSVDAITHPTPHPNPPHPTSFHSTPTIPITTIPTTFTSTTIFITVITAVPDAIYCDCPYASERGLNSIADRF